MQNVSADAPSAAARSTNAGNAASASAKAPKAGKLTPYSQDAHRVPPHSEDAERGVLSSALLAPKEVLPECVEKLDASAFHVPAHEEIYSEMVRLWDEKKPVDFITLTQALKDRGVLEKVGGAPYVTELFGFVPTAANASYYIDIVRDKYVLRRIIHTCTDCSRRAYEETEGVPTLLDDVEREVLSISQSRLSSSMVSMEDQVMEAIEEIERLFERKSEITGVATGFTDLDRMTMGLQPAEMFVIAARPSMGKTALTLNMIEHIAVEQKVPAAVFSLEMSSRQLIQRLLCSRAKVNLKNLRSGFLSERDFPSLTMAASKLSAAKIFIDDTPGISILELRAKARRLKQQHDIGIIAIDYLQLLRSSSKRAQENRQIEIAEISAGVKGLSKELDIPIIVLAQLNRQPEGRGGRPRLSDLRESGSIEQDADVVGLLVRPEVYEDDKERKEEKAGEAELIIAKNRNGPVGDVPLTFLKEFTRFVNRAPEGA